MDHQKLHEELSEKDEQYKAMLRGQEKYLTGSFYAPEGLADVLATKLKTQARIAPFFSRWIAPSYLTPEVLKQAQKCWADLDFTRRYCPRRYQLCSISMNVE